MDNTYVPSIGSAVLAGLAFAQFACAFAGVLLPAGDIVFWVLAVAAVALAGIGIATSDGAPRVVSIVAAVVTALLIILWLIGIILMATK